VDTVEFLWPEPTQGVIVAFPQHGYTLVDTEVGIMGGIVLLLYPEYILRDTEVATMEGIEEDTTAGIMEGITAITVATTEGIIIEVFTHIGDCGDGDIGGGLFSDGPMEVGPIIPMEDTRIWGGPILHTIHQHL